MVDLETRAGVARLREKINFDMSKLKDFRRHWRNHWLQMCGSHYGPRNIEVADRVPMNLLEKAHTVYLRLLAASAPQMLVVPKVLKSGGVAADAEAVLNQELASLRLENELRRWVSYSLGGLGILKVGWKREGSTTDDFGETHPMGRAFFKAVTLDDYIQDMHAKCIDALAYCGHKYRVRLSEAKQRDYWDEKARKQLTATPIESTNPSGDSSTASITRGAATGEELDDTVEIWELFFPQDNRLVTLAVNENGESPVLEDIEWRGPEGGPLHYLYYTEIADQSMPLPPAATWMDLHDLANRLYRKLGTQGENAKTELLYKRGVADDDVAAILQGNDLSAVGVDNPDDFKSMYFNGPDQLVSMLLAQAKADFNDVSGNIDLLGGMGTQSETASQDAMLNANAGARVADMREIVYRRTRNAYEHLAWYYWNDPVRTYKSIRELPNSRMTVPVNITPEMRENNFGRLNFDLVPLSMQASTPEERLRDLNELMTNVLLPLAPEQIDVQGYLSLWARYKNRPEVMSILKPGTLGAQMAEPIGERRQSPVTTRTNVRKNVSTGPTGAGRGMAQVQAAAHAAGATGNGGRITMEGAR